MGWLCRSGRQLARVEGVGSKVGARPGEWAVGGW